MFTFEDLVTVPPATIREIVAGSDKRHLAMALRGANEELHAAIFKGMSSRAVEMLKEDMDVLGPVRSREVHQAQQEILNLARRLEAEGKVVLNWRPGMKCWPEELQQHAAANMEHFDYPCVDAEALLSLEAFGFASADNDMAEIQREPAAETIQAEPVPPSDTYADDLRRSFESGRERGMEEGRAAEREAYDVLAREREARGIECAARLAEDFRVQRARYFETVEHEVVKLALAIAARILRRETQMDPLLLSGAVRAVLGQLSATTEARLRVPASDLELWRDTIANLPNLPLKPAVVGDGEMSPGECVLKTELGTVDLSISSQLAEIERGFFDRAAPPREKAAVMEITEDMWE